MMENITISMEEYKELLIIKGKYEELKMQQHITPTLCRNTLDTTPRYKGE